MNTIDIKDYDESSDTFTVACPQGSFEPFGLPAVLLPALVGEYGEPQELVLRTFEVKMP
jgi:hypothetical protein